ncbi:MAG TPA: hypothetical protein VM580_20305 [Labilithrix sp.]|jgi:hypothetical protein|nr:hypothetical protein [Labilithrix sp.]
MTQFFPPNFRAFRSDWYGKHLSAMHEPSLVQLAMRGETAMRFLWLRTFHQPIAVRVQRAEEGARLVATRLSGMGGYEPGSIDLRRERELGAQECQRVEAALDDAAFETIPPDVNTLGADGAQWIIERAKGGEYRIVDRWSPEAKGDAGGFRRACETFLALAGEDFVTGSIY